MKRLTDTQLRIIERRPPARRIDIPDGQVPGLMLRATPKGTMTWSFQFRVAGAGGTTARGHQLRGNPKHRVTIGRYPAIGLMDAREIASKHKAFADRGEDPRHQMSAAATAGGHTVSSLIQMFLDRHVRSNGLRSFGKLESALRVHVLPSWGDVNAASVTRHDAVALLDRISGPEARRTTQNALHNMYGWAARRGICNANPISGIDLPEARDRDRVLSMDETRAVWSAADKLGYPFGPMYRLMLLTACRRGEWANAQWPWINHTECWLEIPADAYKSGRVHVVPLVGPSMDIVRSITQREAGEYIFSGTNGARPVSGFSRARRRLSEAVTAEIDHEIPDWRPHDFRRSAATHLRRLGIDRYIVKKLLGHADRDVTAIYDRYDLLSERRDALELWASELIA